MRNYGDQLTAPSIDRTLKRLVPVTTAGEMRYDIVQPEGLAMLGSAHHTSQLINVYPYLGVVWDVDLHEHFAIVSVDHELPL
jgi:hypothetical protein